MFARTADGTVVNGYGHYDNTYVKVDGAWRLSTLKLSWLHRDVRPGPPPAPAAA
jgi:hypothetical protein